MAIGGGPLFLERLDVALAALVSTVSEPRLFYLARDYRLRLRANAADFLTAC
jgi:hypothetical protein